MLQLRGKRHGNETFSFSAFEHLTAAIDVPVGIQDDSSDQSHIRPR